MSHLFFNNSIIPSGELQLQSSNRSFRYGDGLFETILISEGKPVFIDLHLERLLAGMKLTGIEVPPGWDVKYFHSAIAQLAEVNNYKHARCRLTVWRGGGGNYLPELNQPELLIELTELNKSDYQLNATGLKVGDYTGMQKQIHPLSACKTANALIYVLAAKYAAENKFDDAVIYNSEGRVADAVSSNIFIFRSNAIFTPAANEGGISGVMRKVVISVCRKEGIPVNEIQMMPDDILKADEFFITNAIKGLNWVGSYGTRSYTNKFASDLLYILNEAKDSHTLD